MSQPISDRETCKTAVEIASDYRSKLPEIVEAIVESCQQPDSVDHIDSAVIPSFESVVEILKDLLDLLFPGYFGNQELDRRNLAYHIGSEVNSLFEKLAVQISRSIQHECRRLDSLCVKCVEKGQEQALEFLRKIPKLRKMLAGDVRAAYEGDPAAKSIDEIVFAYPGLFAIAVYRIAHELHVQGVPLLPRIMTEYAHRVTGIDIHPGAKIGRNFFIDHGTGVVIGETTEIGDNVRIYQGVTLGALSLKREADGSMARGYKRHPTIEDDVIIYAGATILGGETVIGARSIIGGNVWLTSSVPPDSRVTLADPNLKIQSRLESPEPSDEVNLFGSAPVQTRGKT
jgi:serine O-acetyltransferase